MNPETHLPSHRRLNLRRVQILADRVNPGLLSGTVMVDLGGAAVGLEARRARARRLLDPSAPAIAGLGRVIGLHPLDAGQADDDLAVAIACGADAVLLPGAVGRHDIGHLGAKLAVAEADYGARAGATAILVQPADTARGILALAGLVEPNPRLAALVWDEGALRSALGEATAALTGPPARAMLLLAAHAAGCPALTRISSAVQMSDVEARAFDGVVTGP